MEAFPFADTFGVMLIGAFIAMGVYGITTMQAYFYYMYYPKDGISIKWLVGATWILDTLHVILMCHAVHYYLIRGFTEAAVLSDGVWSLYASIATNLLMALISQFFFTVRIYKLSPNYKWCISGFIGFFVFAHLCFGMETVVFCFIKSQFTQLKEISFVAALPFGITAVLSDIVIAAALCILLQNNKSDFKDTNHIINRLIIYAINRCLLTSAVAVVEVVLFSVTPNPFYTFAIDFVIGKLYANSLLAALNSRASFRTTLVESNSTELSTNFVATGVRSEHTGIMHVRSRDSAREYRVQSVDLEATEEEERQPAVSSTMRKTRQPWTP